MSFSFPDESCESRPQLYDPNRTANTDTAIQEKEETKGTAIDTLLDLFANCFPPNLVQVCVFLTNINIESC